MKVYKPQKDAAPAAETKPAPKSKAAPKTPPPANMEQPAMAGTNVALPSDWATQLATAAKDDTATETTDMEAFSLRAGVLSYNGQAMPDNKMKVIVVASAFEKAMFISKFDPNDIKPPLCFALSPDGIDMVPHENSFRKQGSMELDEKQKEIPGTEMCHGCPQLEWGSDPNSPSGRGKMCKETRRLGLLPFDALEGGIDKAVSAMLRVSVTSVGNWSDYVHLLSATMKRPAWSVVTEISVIPNVKNQFTVQFEAVQAINDTALLSKIQAMRERVQKSVLNPYALMTQEQFDAIEAEKKAPKKQAKY